MVLRLSIPVILYEVLQPNMKLRKKKYYNARKQEAVIIFPAAKLLPIVL